MSSHGALPQPCMTEMQLHCIAVLRPCTDEAVDRGWWRTDDAHAVVQTAGAQAALRDLEATAAPQQQAGRRHAHPLKAHLRGWRTWQSCDRQGLQQTLGWFLVCAIVRWQLPCRA